MFICRVNCGGKKGCPSILCLPQRIKFSFWAMAHRIKEKISLNTDIVYTLLYELFFGIEAHRFLFSKMAVFKHAGLFALSAK